MPHASQGVISRARWLTVGSSPMWWTVKSEVARRSLGIIGSCNMHDGHWSVRSVFLSGSGHHQEVENTLLFGGAPQVCEHVMISRHGRD